MEQQTGSLRAEVAADGHPTDRRQPLHGTWHHDASSERHTRERQLTGARARSPRAEDRHRDGTDDDANPERQRPEPEPEAEGNRDGAQEDRAQLHVSGEPGEEHTAGVAISPVLWDGSNPPHLEVAQIPSALRTAAFEDAGDLGVGRDRADLGFGHD